MTKQIAKLEYLKGSKEKMAWAKVYGFNDFRMWTVMNTFYDKEGRNRQDSTFTLSGLKELEIL